ncbi:hypothetical protein N7478_007749 [Penicillium angulare]|uniref:uncharacterized protein n=1 Tax=Penicillium angulare TaxID=116970 RepID=UPI00253FDD56|nr:uncharacterized protein N7478_007749 [Penicillium angulare]KAJ5272624.1 hypothetical protein N7478_007749 [Penicillium angulare]
MRISDFIDAATAINRQHNNGEPPPPRPPPSLRPPSHSPPPPPRFWPKQIPPTTDIANVPLTLAWDLSSVTETSRESAALPTIWTDDISELLALSGKGSIIPSFAHIQHYTPTTQEEEPTVILEMRVAGKPASTKWIPVQVLVKPMADKMNFKHRLSGKCWRYALFNEQSRGLIVGDKMDDMFG